jgi:aminoacrylate hydrolase
VSGLSGTAAFWAQHVGAFAARFTLILHDHRGTGRSSHSQIAYSIEQMADDALQLIDHLGLEKVHFAGHSTGGAIGQTLALDHPGRLDRIVLSATWAGKDPYFDLFFSWRRRLLLEVGREDYLRSILFAAKPPAWYRDHPEELAAMTPEFVEERVPDLHCAASRLDAIMAFDRRADAVRITAPCLVICAADDIVTPPYLSQELAGLVPGSELKLLPDGGHFYPQTRPDDFIAAVTGFVLG